MFDGYVNEWRVRVNRNHRRAGSGGNKLRTYRLFKILFQTESYCKMILPLAHRSDFAKFRCGVAPLQLETGRYEGLPVDERKCPFCRVYVEDEKHVLLHVQCDKYDTIRENLFQKAVTILQTFYALSDDDKIIFFFPNQNMIRACAKACFMILQRRTAFFINNFMLHCVSFSVVYFHSTENSVGYKGATSMHPSHTLLFHRMLWAHCSSRYGGGTRRSSM